MRYLLCLLFVISSLIAQPLNGPFVIDQQTDTLFGNISILTTGDGDVNLFCQDGSVVRVLTVDLDTGLADSIFQFPDPPAGWTPEFWDAKRVDSGWVAVTNEFSASQNRTLAYRKMDDEFDTLTIDSGNNYASEWTCASVNTNVFISLRIEGGIDVGWIDLWDCYAGGWYEAGTCAASVDVTSTWSLGRSYNEFGFFSGHFLLSSADSGGFYTLTDIWTIPFTGIEFCLHERLEDPSEVWCHRCEISVLPQSWITSDGNRFLILGENWPGMEVIEMDTLGQCIEIGYFSGVSIASTGHPEFGFAWLYRDGRGLMLARVGLDGNLVSTPGPLEWMDSNVSVEYSTIEIRDDGLVIASWVERQPSPNDERRLKIASVGWDTFLDSEPEHDISVPNSFTLSAYPNPFNSTVSLAYELPMAGEVSLIIYNLAGREVATLVGGRQNAGRYAVDWTPQTASGIYFANLRAGHEDCISKLVYIR